MFSKAGAYASSDVFCGSFGSTRRRGCFQRKQRGGSDCAARSTAALLALLLLKTCSNCDSIVVQDVLCIAFAQGTARPTWANLVQPRSAVFLLY